MSNETVSQAEVEMADATIEADVTLPKISTKEIEILNNKYGNDVTKLTQAKEHYNELMTNRESIKNRLQPLSGDQNDKKEWPQLSEAEKMIEKLQELQVDHKHLQDDVEKHADTIKRLKSDFEKPLNQVLELQKLGTYLTWLAKIGETNQRLESVLQEGRDYVAVTEFTWFKNAWSEVKDSKCKHLISYLKETLLYWHTVLKERYSTEFEKYMQQMHWPQTVKEFPQPPPTQDVRIKFELYFTYLLQVQLPPDMVATAGSSSGQKILPASTDLPLQVMMLPLQKRFIYHFMGNKQTNRLDKPEWYLTQILTWIRDHHNFLETIVQPVLNTNKQRTNAKAEFVKVLIQMASKRLENDLPELLYDDQLLCHTIDEVLLCHRELHNWGYPLYSEPSLLKVLSDANVFNRWINLEQKCATEKMDQLFSSESAWEPFYVGNGESEHVKTPQCAEGFMTMMRTMTERYKFLPDWQHRLMFLGLQLELLDDFRLRLLQLLGSEAAVTLDSNCCPILNAVDYVLTILGHWKNLPFYICLEYYKENQTENFMKTHKQLLHHEERASSFGSYVGKGDGFADISAHHDDRDGSRIRHADDQASLQMDQLECTVFDGTIELLAHLRSELIQKLVNYVLLEVQAKTRSYRKEKWFCVQVPESHKEMEVSPSAYPMLNVLKSHLQKLQERLLKSLFEKTWPDIAQGLNDYLYEEVILQNVFNEGGAQQLQFDMTRNLFPIFGLYTPKPEKYFKEVKEACNLLNLAKPTALLLKDTLATSSHRLDDEVVRAVLEEQAIFVLHPREALKVLGLRVDLASL